MRANARALAVRVGLLACVAASLVVLLAAGDGSARIPTYGPSSGHTFRCPITAAEVTRAVGRPMRRSSVAPDDCAFDLKASNDAIAHHITIDVRLSPGGTAPGAFAVFKPSIGMGICKGGKASSLPQPAYWLTCVGSKVNQAYLIFEGKPKRYSNGRVRHTLWLMDGGSDQGVRETLSRSRLLAAVYTLRKLRSVWPCWCAEHLASP